MSTIFDYLYPKYKVDKPIRLIELFAGYGSQAMALELLGVPFEHYRVCEFDKYAIDTYNAFHNTNFETSDITKLKADDLGIVDRNDYTYLLTYSSPCTDLSLAGNRAGMEKGSGTRSGLLWEVGRLLKELNGNLPQVLLMENVPQVITAKGWHEWYYFLEILGYKSYCEILNAKDYYIPQNRERCFMVSILGDYSFNFPKPMKLEYTWKDYDDKEELTLPFYLTEKKIEAMKKWNAQQDPFKNINKKRILCPTLTARGAGLDHSGCILIKTNKGIRYLTIRESFRLMGVLDSYIDKLESLNMKKEQLYKQAGNSIVVSVLMAIFGKLLDIDYENIIKETYKK